MRYFADEEYAVDNPKMLVLDFVIRIVGLRILCSAHTASIYLCSWGMAADEIATGFVMSKSPSRHLSIKLSSWPLSS